MGVSDYDVKETDFDRSKSEQYELSTLLGMESFAYLVIEKRSRLILAFRSQPLVNSSTASGWAAHLQRAVMQDDLLRLGLIKSNFTAILASRLTLVPGRLFTVGKEATYLESLTNLGLDDRCRSDELPELGTQLVYALAEEQSAAINRRFSPLRLQHYATGLLRCWYRHNSQSGNRAVYAAVRDRQLTLAALDAGKLHFFNVFPFANAQDALYFHLLAYQQCGWSASRSPLLLCGDILEDSEIYRQLYRFVEDIRFLNFDHPTAVGPQLSTLAPHLYCDLLCQF
ncbi:MAG: DUF3822 family protein [Lewinella sp.]|nr:DUF3822 family protein [Lewinella sp.]